MTAEIVQASYEELDRIASQFGKASTDAAQLRQRVRRGFDPLEKGGWQGRGAAAFTKEMQGQILPALERMIRALEAGRAVTLEIKGVMQRAEEEAARPFHSAKEALNQALKGPGVDTAAINDIVSRASDSELRAIASDAALMGKLRDELPTQDYLNLLVAVKMNTKGAVAHTSAADADALIRDKLKDYLGDAVKADRKISGKVAVVGDEDWKIAGEAHYGKDVWATKSLNGFVDAQGRVWIHKDNGDSGTMVHEAIHKYSSPGMINTSQPMNEGVTEYFTRSLTPNLKPPPRRLSYPDNYAFAQDLVGLVGEKAVAKAYFDGDMAGLKQAYIDAGKSEADWNTMIEHTSKKQWDDARQLAKK